MGFSDFIKKSVYESLAAGDITPSAILVTIGITFLIALYIFMVYRLVGRKSFYDRNFNVTVATISIITAGIVLAMQSSLVISLGMVGALSIVRFRTAVKNPMDLLFLFWSIGTGIICGAGLYELAVILAVCVTIAIMVLNLIPASKSNQLIVINANDRSVEAKILELMDEYTKSFTIDSKNLRGMNLDMVIEIRSDEENVLIDKLSELEGVMRVSLVAHDGEIKG